MIDMALESLPIQTEPILVTRFKGIRKNPNIRAESVALASIQDVFADPAYRQECFEESKSAWMYAMGKDEDSLDRMLQVPPTEDILKKLKDIRHYGQILRSSYKCFDERHDSPQSFDRFLHAYGTLLDNYFAVSPDRAKLLEEVVSYMPSVESAELYDFQPASDASFRKYIDHGIELIDLRLAQSQQPTETFHKLRKNIRTFMNLMQVPAAQGKGRGFEWLFWELYGMSKQLGIDHDFVVKDFIDKPNQQDTMLSVPEKFHAEFRALKPYILASVGEPVTQMGLARPATSAFELRRPVSSMDI